MKKDKLEYFVLILVAACLGGVLLLVGVRYILPVLLPFLIAWAVAFAVRRPSGKISAKLHISERIVRPVLAILSAFSLLFVLGMMVKRLINLLWTTLSEIGEGNNPIYDFLYALEDGRFTLFGRHMPKELADKMSDALGELISSALSRLADAITGFAGAVPKGMFFIVVTFIAIIYFAIDLEKINTRVRHLVPKSVAQKLSAVKERAFHLGVRCLKSYAIIFTITFSLTFAGFLILGVDGAFTIAFIVAFLDLLPVIGVGTVLVPWSIFGFATGNHFIGIGMLVLFLVNTVVRELLEPKILGKNLGIHPILSLLLIYAGYAFFGFFGLLLAPIAAGVIGALTKRGELGDDDSEKSKSEEA